MAIIYNIPKAYWPVWAKCAFERLQSDSKLRTAPQLMELLTAYASTYGIVLNPDDGGEHESTVCSVETQCSRAFSDYLA